MNNNDIDDLLKLSSLQEVKIPEKIENKISNTLRNCQKKKPNFFFYFGRLIATIVTGLTLVAGGVGVYAAMGGEIAGKPVVEFLGIKLSDKTDEYKQQIEGQEITYKDTKIELVSSICSEGITILEFDVKLSKEDKEKLLLDQSIVRQEDYDNFEKYKNDLIGI